MKILRTFIKIAIFCFLFAGCNKENLKSELLGKWLWIDNNIDYKFVIEFDEDYIYKEYINDSLSYKSVFKLSQKENINEILLNDKSKLINAIIYNFRGPDTLVLTYICVDCFTSPPPAIYVRLK